MPAKNKQNRKKAKPIGKSSKIIDLDVVNEANSQVECQIWILSAFSWD